MTPRALQAIELAQTTARELGHHYWGTEHLLIGLATTDGGVASRVLTDLGYTSEHLRGKIRFLIGDGTDAAQEGIASSPRVERVLNAAKAECAKREETVVTTLHLLFALIKEREGVAVMLLETPGVGLERIGGRMDQAFRDSLKDE